VTVDGGDKLHADPHYISPASFPRSEAWGPIASFLQENIFMIEENVENYPVHNDTSLKEDLSNSKLIYPFKFS
jgi:hypothetical protein